LTVLDNCAEDRRLDALKNNQLEFMSPSSTSLVQAMDMGITKIIEGLI
jgi:hypothetical protein